MAAQTAITLTLTDKNSLTVYTASITEGGTTTAWADKYSGTAEYNLLKTPLLGNITVTATAAQKTQTTVSGFVYYEVGTGPKSYPFSITLDNATTGTDSLPINGYFVGISTTLATLVSPSFSPSISPSYSASISASPSPSKSASISPSFSSSLSPSLSASFSASVSPSYSASKSSSLSPSASLSASPSPSVSASKSSSLSPSASISASVSPSAG